MSTERLARFALAALLVGLALHNALLAQLWELGVRGGTLDVVAAWKEALLLVALVVLAVKVRGRGGAAAVDVLALSYTVVVVLYAVVPQDWLGGEATTRGELLALRHHLLPVAGYALGRLTAVWWSDRSRVGAILALVAAGVAVVGLVDLALVELQAWRESGVPGWYREQLRLDYEGLSGLPENWVHDPSGEEGPLRRLVSIFLSPNASAFAFVVGLVFVVSRPIRWWWALVGLLLYAGLLYTHALVAVVALALGLVVLTVAQRRSAPAFVAIACVVVAAGFFAAYPAIGASTSYTEEELEFLRENPAPDPRPSSDPFTSPETSAATRARELRNGLEAVFEHPQGYGLGNAGSVAQRTGEEVGVGESTYTELGIDTGIAGAVAFVLWSLALLRALLRREPWVGAAFASVLLLGLWTNVVGVHWLAVGLWAAAGIAVSPPEARVQE